MLTKREKVVLTIASILGVIFLFIPQEILTAWEYASLFCIVLPVGLYIATDPERIKRNLR